MHALTVRWRGAVYEIATCLNAERAALAAERWPDGVIELATLLDPAREFHPGFTEAERRALLKLALRALGELEPVPVELPTPGKARMVPVPATFGTTGQRPAWSPMTRRRAFDHAFVTELAAQQKPAPSPLPGYAVTVRLTESSGSSSSSPSTPTTPAAPAPGSEVTP